MKALHLLLAILIVCLAAYPSYAGLTGKITGVVKDGRTGEPLINANVVVSGTSMGAATNPDGYYVILNVPPGTYRIRASLIGYTPTTIVDVRVEIDQTTTSNITLNEEGVQAQEVVIVATRPVVQKDVSASRANITAAEVQALPVGTVAQAIGLQAGIETTGDGKFQIRGGGVDQTAFMIDGQNLRDARDNSPYTGISLTSIQDVQVQTGGFTAEYGNIRSGLVNVITKEGSTSNYNLSFIGRYHPAAPKHFGSGPNDPNSFWIRPYVDPAVCWTGTTNGAWDAYTQNQYTTFQGWNAVSQATLADNNPNNDLSPQAAQRLFLFQHRKQTEITKPDYDVDASFSGPVIPDPKINEQLGNLRLLAAYRQTQSEYLVPLSQDGERDYNAQLKLTSDVGKGMKVQVEGLQSKTLGTNDNNSGLGGYFTTAGDVSANGLDYTNGSYRDAAMFGTDYWAPTIVKRYMIGGKFSHVINQSTFYDVSIHWFQTKYSTNPAAFRDTSKIYLFGNSYYADEAPYGYPNPASSPVSGIGSSMNMDLGWSGSRDSSVLAVTNLKFNITSQLDRFNQLQGGLEFVYTDNNVNYANIEPRLPTGNTQSTWHTFPVQGAAYVQDKIEFEGMIANLGLRLDYSNAGGKWFSPYNLYDPRFANQQSLGLDSLLTVPTKKIVTLSPRLGISFPVSDDSKVYFNYGHFRSLPAPENLFLIRRFSFTDAIARLANPNNPLPLTIQYELGYEQSILDQYLLRVAGYYKDVSDETRLVRYTGVNTQINYTVSTPNTYEDIRGFELTASKNRGDWIQGWINYTYEVSTSGYFGVTQIYQDPGQQRNYLATNIYQTKPTPTPFARANVNLFTPAGWGPDLLGHKILGDWRFNLVGSWFSGTWFTWSGPGNIPGILNNVQWTDSWSVDLRVSKNFHFSRLNIELFADINNLFNIQQLSYKLGFYNGQDFFDYMQSLHLPYDIAGDETHLKLGYPNHPGNDKPGDYRTVPYKPYDPDNPNPSDKSYIDMPNQPYLAFLNPRAVFYGVRLSIDI